SGGWGWFWVGMPDRGTGPDQPGGWVYSVLPYVEQGALRRLGSGQTGAALKASILQLLSTPVPGYNCPSRRDGGPFNANGNGYFVGDPLGPPPHTLVIIPTTMARTDYGANTGSQARNEIDQGPGSLDAAPGFNWQPNIVGGLSGIMYRNSRVRMTDILRGT